MGVTQVNGSETQVYKYTSTQEHTNTRSLVKKSHTHTYTQVLKLTSTQLHKNTNKQIYKNTSIQVYKYTSTITMLFSLMPKTPVTLNLDFKINSVPNC